MPRSIDRAYVSCGSAKTSSSDIFVIISFSSRQYLSRIFNIMVSPVLAGAEETDVQFSCGVIDRGVEACDLCYKLLAIHLII